MRARTSSPSQTRTPTPGLCSPDPGPSTATNWQNSIRRAEQTIRYVPYELDDWNTKYLDPYMSITGQHTNEHLKHLNWLAATGQYNLATDELEPLIGRPGQTVTTAIEQRPDIFHPYGAVLRRTVQVTEPAT